MVLAGVPASEFGWWSHYRPLLRGDPEPGWRCWVAIGLTLGILLSARASARHPRRARSGLVAFVLLLAPAAALARESITPLLTSSVAGTLAFLALLDCERRAQRDPSSAVGGHWPLWPAFVLTPGWLLGAWLSNAFTPPRTIGGLFVAAWNAQDRAGLARFFTAPETDSIASDLDAAELPPVTGLLPLDSKDPSNPDPRDWITVEFTLADGSGLCVWFRKDGRFWSARSKRSPRALALQVDDFEAAFRDGDLQTLRGLAAPEFDTGSLESLAATRLGPFRYRSFALGGDEVRVGHRDEWETLLWSTWGRLRPEGWRLTAVDEPR